MKAKELRDKSTGELKKMLQEERERVRELRFKVSQDQHKDVRELREARKLVARILTIIRTKQGNAS